MYSLLANFPPEQHKNCLKSARIPAQFLHFSDEKFDGAICTSDLIRASLNIVLISTKNKNEISLLMYNKR